MTPLCLHLETPRYLFVVFVRVTTQWNDTVFYCHLLVMRLPVSYQKERSESEGRNIRWLENQQREIFCSCHCHRKTQGEALSDLGMADAMLSSHLSVVFSEGDKWYNVAEFLVVSRKVKGHLCHWVFFSFIILVIILSQKSVVKMCLFSHGCLQFGSISFMKFWSQNGQR
jgi:hypothetical protein